MILRDYMYLDTGRLQDYMSSLDAGVIEEFTETNRSQTDKEGKAGLKASIAGAGVDAGAGGRSEEETTRERTVRVRAQNMFNRIYDELDENDAIKVFDEEVSLTLDKVRRKEVVEITGSFAPSPLNDMIDSILNLMNIMEEMGFVEEAGDPQTQQAIRALAMIFRGDEGKEEVPMVSRVEQNADLEDNISVVFLAKSRFIVVDQEDFEGDMTVFGKVQKLVPEGESIDLFDFLKLPKVIRREANLKEELFKMFETWPKELGGPIARESTEVQGPALVVTPVAVYEA